MGNFVQYLQKKLTERSTELSLLSKYLGKDPSYISKLLVSKKPPSPHKTDIYTKLDRYYNEPDGTFERLALIDILGKEKLNRCTDQLYTELGHVLMQEEDEAACKKFLHLDEPSKKAVRNMIDLLAGKRQYDCPETQETNNKIITKKMQT